MGPRRQRHRHRLRERAQPVRLVPAPWAPGGRRRRPRPGALDLHRRAHGRHGHPRVARGAPRAAVRLRLRRCDERRVGDGAHRRRRPRAPPRARGRRRRAGLDDEHGAPPGSAGRALPRGRRRPRRPRGQGADSGRRPGDGLARPAPRGRRRGRDAHARGRAGDALVGLQGGLSERGGPEVRRRAAAGADGGARRVSGALSSPRRVAEHARDCTPQTHTRLRTTSCAANRHSPPSLGALAAHPRVPSETMPEPPPPRVRERLRELPSVDRLATSVARAELAERRAEVLAGDTADVDLVARARGRLRPSLRRVLTATGVVVHTTLGRAPLAASARAAVAAAAEGYSNLELDLATGERGSRHAHVESLLREVTGAQAGLAVNNCAAAVLLAAAALAGPGREVVVSRGQLIEIGGGFRIPEVVGQAGARLVEVGAPDRTRRGDCAAALGERTGVILRAHPSNFRTVGFTEEVEIEALCGLGVPVVDDVGSGVPAAAVELLADEPAVRRSVRAGAAVVCFSADKLLGGPQGGLLVGTSEAIDACRRHPLARAVRIDKLSLAALEATLALYRDPELARAELPVLAMLEADPATLEVRARRLAEGCGGEVVASTAKVGGGALPLLELPGPAVAIDVAP